jgi:hypothetical protein
MRVIRHRYFRRVSNSLQRSDASDRRLTDILCAGNRLTGTTCSSVRCASMTQNESCDAMPRKRRVRKRPTGVSGLAATLLRDKIAPFDTPQYRRRFGKLIVGAVRPVRETPASRRKIRPPTTPK